jgi:hypothetical protein
MDQNFALLSLLCLAGTLVCLVVIAINSATTAKYSRFSAHFLKLLASKSATEDELTLTERKAS